MFKVFGKKKKEDKYDAHMFRRMADKRSDVSLGFPVAVRLSKASKDDDNPSWTSIRAQQIGNERDKPKDDLMYLSHSTSYEWSGLVLSILQLPFNIKWQLLIVVSIVAHISIEMWLYMFMVKLRQMQYCFWVHVITMVITDGIYLCDFIIAMLHNYWIRIREMIKVKRRSKEAMVVDIISLIPTSYTYLICIAREDRVPDLVFLFRFIIFIRMYRVFVITTDWVDCAEHHHWKAALGRVFLYFFLLLHFFTCLWFHQACIGPECESGEVSWLMSRKLSSNQRHWSEWYLISVYYTITTVCNLGLGDVHATTLKEYFLSLFGMVTGLIICTGLYIGTVTSLLVNSAHRKTTFVNRINSIKNHLRMMKMTKPVKVMLLEYYFTLWNYKRGVKSAKEIAILPKPLQMEVAYDINVSHFERSRLFCDLSEPFLRQLSLLMRNEFYLPGGIIYYQNVAKNMMICVASGVIEILSDEDNQSPIVSFTTGTILGEVSMLLTIPAKATVRAATYTELQVLHKVDFFRMMIDYPDVQDKIQKNIMDRISRARNRDAHAKKNDFTMSLFVSRHSDRTAIWILKDKLRPKRKKAERKGKHEEETDESLSEHFDSSMLGLYNLSKNISVIDDKSPICTNDRFPFILEPDTVFTHMWEYFIAAVATLMGFCIPYYTAYIRVYPNWLKFVVMLTTLLYIADLLITCCTAIQHKTTVINKFLSIVYKRMETWEFYVSVIACFPLEIFTYVMSGLRTERLYSMLVINRLAKFWCVHTFFQKLEKGLLTNLVLVRMIKYTLRFSMACHWAGALLYLISCYDIQCDTMSWFHQQVLTEVHGSKGSTCHTTPVLMSMYFAQNILSGVGYGDIAAGNMNDAAVLCLLMVIGVVAFGFAIGELTATLAGRNLQRDTFQHMISAIKQFMLENRIVPSLRQRVFRYFQFQWLFDKGAKATMVGSLIDDATIEMRQEVLSMDRLPTVIEVPLFSLTDLDYVQLIASCSKVLVLPPNEIITYAGSISREMYIMQKGYCTTVLENKKNETVMGPGSHFGDIELLFGIPMAVTVKSITYCKVISIEYSVYLQAISLFPFIMKEMQELTEAFSEEIASIVSKRKVIHFDRHHQPTRTTCQQLYENLNTCSEDVADSFLNVKQQCRLTKETYAKPFARLGKMRWLRFLLLPYCILPGSRFLKIWVFARLIAALLVGLIVPIQRTVSPFYPMLLSTVYMLDIFAYVDMYMMLHKGYYNKKGLLVTHTFKTAQNYLTTNFIMDFIGCFPFEYITLLFENHTEGHDAEDHINITHPQHCILRLLRVLQLYRLIGVSFYLKANIEKRRKYLDILKFFPVVFVFINVCTSILVSSTCKYRHYDPEEKNDLQGLSKELQEVLNSEVVNVRERNFTAFQGNMTSHHISEGSSRSDHTHDTVDDYEGHIHMHCLPGCWIMGSHFANTENPLDVYTIGFYWITNTVTTVGFGDITPLTSDSLLKMLIVIVVSSLLFGYILASIASTRASLNNVTLYYQELIRELISFMEQECVDQDLQNRLVEHFQYEWRRTHGVESQSILVSLHTALKEDCVSCMYEHTLREVPIFENVEPSFFRVFGRHVQQSYIMRGQTIIRSQDVQSNIYIIYRGKVDVLSSYNEMLACMGPGGLFGNIASTPPSICSVTIYASRNVDALVISSELFYSVLKQYPLVMQNMTKVLLSAKDFIMPTTIINDGSSTSVLVETEEDVASEKELRKSTSTSTLGSIQTTMTTNTSNASNVNSIVGVIGTLGHATWIFLPHKWFKFGILPTSFAYTLITHIVFIVTIINCVSITYGFTFQDENIGFLLVSMSFELVFYMKILLTLHEGFIEKYGDFNCDNKKIRERFFKNRKKVMLEFIPNIPFDLLCLLAPNGRKLAWLSYIRLLHMLRFIYVIQYFRQRRNILMANKMLISLLSIGCYMILLTHFAACTWYFIACPFTECKRQSWAYYALEDSSTPFMSYIKSLYFSFSLFSATGYGDIVPHQMDQVIFTIFLMILGKFAVGLFIGAFTEYVSSSTSSLSHYEYGVNKVRDSMLNQYLSSHQMEKVWNYVQQLWRHGRGKQMPRLILQAPYVLKSDVMNAMYGQHLRNSYAFNKLDDNFLRQLTVRLLHFAYFKGNYIVQCGDTDQKMYFIHRGEVDVLTVRSNLTETVHDVLRPGDVFGMAQGLFHGLPHNFSFRAKTTVDIVTLSLDSWYTMLQYFPEAKTIIYQRAANIYMQV